MVITQEEILWYQKSRCGWITCDHRNTKYFHQKTIQWRRCNRIEMLKDNDGNWVQDDNQLKNMAVQFFKLIYTDLNPCYRQYHLIGLFPSLCDSDLANISHLVDDIEI